MVWLAECYSCVSTASLDVRRRMVATCAASRIPQKNATNTFHTITSASHPLNSSSFIPSSVDEEC